MDNRNVSNVNFADVDDFPTLVLVHRRIVLIEQNYTINKKEDVSLDVISVVINSNDLILEMGEVETMKLENYAIITLNYVQDFISRPMEVNYTNVVVMSVDCSSMLVVRVVHVRKQNYVKEDKVHKKVVVLITVKENESFVLNIKVVKPIKSQVMMVVHVCHTVMAVQISVIVDKENSRTKEIKKVDVESFFMDDLVVITINPAVNVQHLDDMVDKTMVKRVVP